jgi:hypothetical protein
MLAQQSKRAQSKQIDDYMEALQIGVSFPPLRQRSAASNTTDSS